MNLREQKAARARARKGETITTIAKSMLVTRNSVYKAINKEHTNTKPQGRPKSQGRQDLGEAVEQVLQDEGPQQSIRGLSTRFMAPHNTMKRAVQEDLGLKSLRRTKRHDPGETDVRLLKSILALDWLEDPRNANRVMAWSDEKHFQCCEPSNPAAQRFLAPNLTMAKDTVPDNIRHVRRQMKPKQLTVYIALYSSGEFFMKIYEPRTKIDKHVYIECLEEQVAWQREMFGDPQAEDAPVFTQDGATPHTANLTQDWLRDNYGNNFWDKDMWPPRSPEFNPLDARAWGTMDAKLCSDGIPSTYEELEETIRRVAEEVLTPEYIRNICSLERARIILREIIDHNGGNID